VTQPEAVPATDQKPPDPLGILESPAVVEPKGTGTVTVSPRTALRRGQGAFRFALLALAGFGLVFAAVKAKRTAPFDLAVTLQVQADRSPSLRTLMAAVSWPGFPPQSRLIPPALIGAMWAFGYRLEALFQLGAWSNGLLSTGLKSLTQRDRPVAPQVAVVVAPLGGSSFPSGHVLTYVGLYGFLAYLAHSLIKPPLPRWLTVTSLTGLVGLVGPSRIYQGHHWATDVLASYLLGLATLIGWTALYRRLKAEQVARQRARRHREHGEAAPPTTQA
jgi:undecaprenyl-diphosphatase